MLPGDDDGGEHLHVSISRGGPIYVPNMVSPITKVTVFETSISLELQVSAPILLQCICNFVSVFFYYSIPV